MKTRTFYIAFSVLMLIGTASTVALLIYGYKLWQTISIVELIANWG